MLIDSLTYKCWTVGLPEKDSIAIHTRQISLQFSVKYNKNTKQIKRQGKRGHGKTQALVRPGDGRTDNNKNNNLANFL